MKRSARIATLAILATLSACGLDNALVGGRCRDGLAEESGRCVEVAPPGVNVIVPGGPPTSSLEGGAVVDATPPIIVVTGDAGPIPTDAAPPGTVTPPPPKPPDAASPPPPLVCQAPLVACRGACISVDHDPANCGACGKICPSNLCAAGACVGATPGDVVLVGHDFTNAIAGSAQAKVLVNAASLPTTDPIRILSYEEGADATAVAQAKSLVETGVRGRSVAFTRASASDLESSILALAYDVVLLHDASSDDPAALGARWSTSLPAFAKKGGVVIALDGAASRMPELVTAAGLFQIGGHATLAADAHLIVSAPADVVGAQVISPYAPFGNAITFSGLTIDADVTVVVRDETSSAPVVVHGVVR